MDMHVDYRNITWSKITALSMKKCSGNSETVEKKCKNKVKFLFTVWSLIVDDLREVTSPRLINSLKSKTDLKLLAYLTQLLNTFHEK